MAEASIATVASSGRNQTLAIKKPLLNLNSGRSDVKKSRKMDETKFGRRERRRRKVQMKMEGSQPAENEFQKTVENSEFSIGSHVTQSLGKLTRRDTYTVLHSKSDHDVANVDDVEDDFNVKSEGSGPNSAESRNLTYSLDKSSESFNHCTYNIDKPPVSDIIRPVPAPRSRKSIRSEPEKVSSDTDRDITEIDLDDLKSPKSDRSSKPSPIYTSDPKSESRGNDIIVPVPKPRKSVKNVQKLESTEQVSVATPIKTPEKEDSSEKTHKSDAGDTARPEPSDRPNSSELPLVTNLQEEAKSDEPSQKPKKRKSLGDLIDRKGKRKKSKTFSSLMKLERKKIPKISSILKDLKEEEKKPEVEEDKPETQIDSPRYKESAQNGRIYVQGKNGFHVMERDEVLKTGNDNAETDGNGGLMENSNVKTAVLFQKFWSRSMTYFHGVLAGIGFSHAATVTAIMLHHNYDPQRFISVYSCLSLKIHYVFYALTALCIVSSFDRVDIGHMNRRHWETALKSPSAWVVLALYVSSFVLTFVNQKSESRFDALPKLGNDTEIWPGESQSEVQVNLLQWYHSVWARDVLVLFAWLVIALTKFDDFLHSHINNMAKYANVEEEKKPRRKADYF